jgi:hypothetical protein
MPSDTYILTISDVGVSTPADGSVTTVKIADYNVAIAGTGVTTAKIVDGAITSAKIANGTIGEADIADSAITSAKIANGTIVAGDIADGAITSAKILDGTIAAVDIANGAVTTDKIGTGTIVNNNIASNTITLGKIATIGSGTILGNATGSTTTIATSPCTAFGFQMLAAADVAGGKTVLGLGSMATQESTAVSITGGTIANVALSGTSVNVASPTGTLPVGNGGTGFSNYTSGDLIYANGATSFSKLAKAAATYVLHGSGSGSAPSWGSINLATDVTGILPTINGGTGGATTDTLTFATTGLSTDALATGELRWNTTDQTLDLKLAGDVTLQVGQEQNILVSNAEGSLISNGTAVYIFGYDSTNGIPSVKIATSVSNLANRTLGLATQNISIGGQGYITLTGLVRGLGNTTGLTTSGLTAGDEIWLGIDGKWSPTQQSFIRSQIKIGHVIIASSSGGSVLVNPRIIAGPAGSRVGGIVSTNSTETSTTVQNTLTLLNSYTIAATAFRANGTVIKGRYIGQITGTNVNRQITATFNGSTVFDSTAFNPNASGDWRLDLELARVDATALDVFATLHCHGQPTAMRTTQFTRLGSLTLDSADYALVVNGLTTSATPSVNAVIHKYSDIHWGPTGS